MKTQHRPDPHHGDHIDCLIQQQPADTGIGLVKNLGKVMFTDFLLPFEITSVLLLAAMVGAIMLGKSEAAKR